MKSWFSGLVTYISDNYMGAVFYSVIVLLLLAFIIIVTCAIVCTCKQKKNRKQMQSRRVAKLAMDSTFIKMKEYNGYTATKKKGHNAKLKSDDSMDKTPATDNWNVTLATGSKQPEQSIVDLYQGNGYQASMSAEGEYEQQYMTLENRNRNGNGPTHAGNRNTIEDDVYQELEL